MAVTISFEDTYEALVAGDLSGQAGYTEIAPASGHTVNVNAGSQLVGTNSVTLASAGGATTSIAVESAIGATRGTNDFWRLTFRVKVLDTAQNGRSTSIVMTAGAVVVDSWTTDALDVGFEYNSGTALVDMRVWDSESTPSAGAGNVIAGVFSPGGSGAQIRVDITSGDRYTVEVDADNDGEGWVAVRSGLIVAANRAITRFSYVSSGATFASTTHFYDNVRFLAITNPTQIALQYRQERQIAVTAASRNGDRIEITAQITDLTTGAALAIRPLSADISLMDPAPGQNIREKINALLDDELRRYDYEQRVGDLVGHQRVA